MTENCHNKKNKTYKNICRRIIIITSFAAMFQKNIVPYK